MKASASSARLLFLAAAVAPASLATVAACSASTLPAAPPRAGDAGTVPDAATGVPDRAVDGGPACTTTADCASGESCLFEVGSCSAKGQCVASASLGPLCNIVVEYCGCDGTTVGGLCGTDYAEGPTLGQSAPCADAEATAPPGATLSTLVEAPESAPEWLATDGTNVYVAGTGAGTVTQVPVGGGAAVTLASNQSQPFGIVTDGTSVFWTNQASGGSGGTVMKVAVGGGAPVRLASGQGAPAEMAIDATNVYWLDIGGNDGVMTVPIAGGTPLKLAPVASPFGLAVDGTSVYFTDGDTILSVPRGGGTPVTLATNQNFPFELAVDATTLYWSSARGAGAILSMPKTGGTPTTLASSTGMTRIAIDGTTLYFTAQNGAPNAGIVASVPLSGGVPTTLVTEQASPEGIVVDGTGLYWVDTGLGAVMALTPK